MDCKTLKERISDYLDGQLQDPERREIAAHLDACQACRLEVEAYQKTVDLVRDLPLVPAPEGLADRILQKTLHVRPGSEALPAAVPARISGMLPVLRGVAAAAVFFLFAYLGYQVVDRQGEWKAPPRESETASVPIAGKDSRPALAAKGVLALREPVLREEAVEEALKKAENDEKWGSPRAETARKSKEESRSAADREPRDAGAEDKIAGPGQPAGAPGGEAGKAPGDAAERHEEKQKEQLKGESRGGGLDRGDRREAERAKSDGPAPGTRKSGKSLGAPPAAEPLPVTLLVKTGDPAREQEMVEAVLEEMRIIRRPGTVRRALEAGRPADKRAEPPEGAVAPGAVPPPAAGESGYVRGAEAGKPGETPAGKYGREEDAPAAARPPGAPAKDGESAEELERQGRAPDGGVQKENRKEGDARGIEIRLPLSEYRLFKQALADISSRFEEVPSNRLVAFLRAELRDREEEAEGNAGPRADSGGGSLEGGEGRALDQMSKELRSRRKAAPGEPTVVLTIRFEAEVPAGFGAAPAPSAVPEGKATEKKAEEKDR
jgi:hypothetical protein